MKFTEAKLEEVFISLFKKSGFTYIPGGLIQRELEEVLIEEDLRSFLQRRYSSYGITESEINSILLKIKTLPSSDLYESNKSFMRMVSDGFILKREDHKQKDIYIQLIDYSSIEEHRLLEEDKLITVVGDRGKQFATDENIYKFVNQLEIVGDSKRIPDGILYINGLPLVVFEFKSAIREEATIYDAYKQLTVRYKRDIPELFKYNAFCIISDGVNNKAGSYFAPYEFYYAWRRYLGKTSGDAEGIDSIFSMIKGLFNRTTLIDVIRNFIFFPDNSRREDKIVCRYPQYYAARALYQNIKFSQKPNGSGKGGTYFGATGSGKSYTMLYLTRLLMRSKHFESPTIVLITDRTDLDDQLSRQFVNAKIFIGDDNVESVESRADLRNKLRDRQSGGVFLTTIHKFTEDTQLLTERNNVICISDEAHRSQINLDQKIRFTEKGVVTSYGFAKYLHDSLPNATYVGFTGTPIDATLDVFGKVIDAYTMTESVNDEITVRIVYEGRAALVALDNSKLQEIEEYYSTCAEEGSNENQIEQSKREMLSMNAIIGDPKRLTAVAEDFITHYEKRLSEGATVMGKAMFVCSSREIAYQLYKKVIELRPLWAEQREAAAGVELSDRDRKDLKPIEYIKLVMTRSQDDPKELWDMLGTSDDRKELDRQFKNPKSNFKVAIVVDMWLTGFDVPFLDTIYIDKPIQRHNLIQTISRVNRKYEGKNKGLVVDYIGIKKQMNIALKEYSDGDKDNFEDVKQSLVVVKNHLDLLNRLFHTFDSSKYFATKENNFKPDPFEQLTTLNEATEFVQLTKKQETRFMNLVKRLKAAYDICAGSEQLTQQNRDETHFYLAVRSILFKLTKGDAPDTAQMNERVREMIKNALQSNGVVDLNKSADKEALQEDLFDDEYLRSLENIKMPHTKIKLLLNLLKKSIDDFRKVNQAKGIDFSKKMELLVNRYNNRDANSKFTGKEFEEFTDNLIDLLMKVKNEFAAGDEIGITFEEKAFYDILESLCVKYNFTYPEDKLIILAKEIKQIVDEQAKFPDWNKRADIKAALKVELILTLDKFGYPPIERDEVYLEIFQQAENFKKYRG